MVMSHKKVPRYFQWNEGNRIEGTLSLAATK